VLPDGSVTAPPPVLTASDPGTDVLRAVAAQQQAAHEARRRAEAGAREALAAAAECDADAARALAGAEQLGQLLARLLPGALGVLASALPPTALLALLGPALLAEVDGRRLPDAGSDPHRVAAWWASLSPGAQADLLRDHPGALGRLDGLPGAVRDAANRALLSAERRSLVAQLAVLAPDDPAHGRLRRAVAALDAVERVIALPERRLLVLDLTGEQAVAAVAVGDVDTAAHVAVFVPGFSTTVSGALTGHDGRADALRRQADGLSTRSDGGGVAVVSWLGYEAPQARDVLRPTRSVLHDEAARRGAERLSAFWAGLDASRSTPVHLTALGHSYGSLTTGLALGPGTPVDDVVLFGSPGIGTSDVRELGLQPGRVNVVEARRDAVADLAAFGPDPNQLDGVTGLSAREAVVDGRRLSGSIGHSSYLSPGSTSQYGIAAVVAGLPELAPRDDGSGVGDWLNRPAPWLRR
jgi:hypothetical protein